MSEVVDFGLIVATFLGPVFAVQAQKWVEGARGKRERRIDVFKTLMATRGTATSVRHVEALNMIDLEFPAQKFPAIRNAWRNYLDHLSTPQFLTPESPGSNLWVEKRTEFLVKLLGAMGSALGYSFDEVDLKKGAYVPQQHIDDAAEQRQLRLGFLKLLAGTTGLKTEVTSFPSRPMTVVTRDERA